MAIALLLLCLTGCQTARSIVEAQSPGVASGAGAAVTGPTNSAQQTTQTASRTIAFSVPAVPAPQPKAPSVDVQLPPAVTQALPQAPSAPVAPQPVWMQETVQTSIGAHQDAAGIVKVAVSLSKWGTVRWLGLLCVVIGIGGLLHAAGNNEGYPLVWVKTAIAGVVLLIVGDNPWMLLLLLIPLGFYAAQKLGLLRIPAP